MSFISQGQLAQNGDFLLKVKIAMITFAQIVEAETETTKRLYQKRHDYALHLLNEPDSKLSAFAFGVVAALPSADINTPDSTIQTIINTIFNYYVGTKASDATIDFP